MALHSQTIGALAFAIGTIHQASVCDFGAHAANATPVVVASATDRTTQPAAAKPDEVIAPQVIVTDKLLAPPAIAADTTDAAARQVADRERRPPKFWLWRAGGVFVANNSGSLPMLAAMRRASLLLGWEEPWRENFNEFVLLDPRAPSRAVVRTVAGEHKDLADVLVSDVDPMSGSLRRSRSGDSGGLVGGVSVMRPV